MADNDSPEGGRRRRMLRGRSGLAFSGSSLSDSTVTEGVAPASDDPELNDIVEQAAQNAPLRRPVDPAALLPPPPQEEGPSPNDPDFNPRARLEQVSRRSSEYEREYRLDLLHRMLMRKLPLDEIANQLGISVRQLYNDRRELADRLRSEARLLDVDHIIGDSKGFYEEVQALAMRAASNSNMPMPMRLAAMRTALASHNDKHRFYQAAGVYDVLRFRKGAGEGNQTDIQRLMALTDELLTETKRDNRQATNPNPLGDFSGTDSEVVEL